MPTALISVSDKEGLLPFARRLEKTGWKILSSGGTAAALSDGGVKVTPVSDYTQSPEILGGRVKTLHPRIHGGILSKRTPEHNKDLLHIGAEPIDLVAVNLYPFQQCLESGGDPDALLGKIDIGGPTMIRAAAKSFPHVWVVVDPQDYSRVLEALDKTPREALEARRGLAEKAFRHTCRYDSLIAGELGRWDALERDEEKISLPGFLKPQITPRYGENPHQTQAGYSLLPGRKELPFDILAEGKGLSYNNLLDLEAAWGCAMALESPAAAVIKHSTPCGAAKGQTSIEAYARALKTDPVSAFGSVVGVNGVVDEACARAIGEVFTEVLIAKEYTPQGLAVLKAKKNLRILQARQAWGASLTMRTAAGGMLVQNPDRGGWQKWEAVTDRKPTETEERGLQLAWNVVGWVKSNAVVFADAQGTLSLGGGQTSRVGAVELAARIARIPLKGSVLASDAFFPFPDGLQAAVDAGATAIVQPGGSVRDKEVIAAANALGVAMVFTGRRRFRH